MTTGTRKHFRISLPVFARQGQWWHKTYAHPNRLFKYLVTILRQLSSPRERLRPRLRFTVKGDTAGDNTFEIATSDPGAIADILTTIRQAEKSLDVQVQ